MRAIIFILSLSVIIIYSQTSCQKTTNPGSGTKDTIFRTLTLKPGPDDGKDALVSSVPIYAPYNLTGNPDITASQWTYGAQGYGEGTVRSYLEFEALDGLPDSAMIQSAKLYLYGLDVNKGTASPEGNSYYPGSPYNGSGDNSAWIKKVTGNWDIDSITWNNKPPTTDLDEVAVAPSTSQWNNNVTIDVTRLVQDIVNTKQNYGFCLQLQNEQTYRSINFAGSRNSDSTRWPKLVVTYLFH